MKGRTQPWTLPHCLIGSTQSTGAGNLHGQTLSSRSGERQAFDLAAGGGGVHRRGADGADSLPVARTSWSEPPLAGPATTASWIRAPLSLCLGFTKRLGGFCSRHGTGKKRSRGRGHAGATVVPSGMEYIYIYIYIYRGQRYSIPEHTHLHPSESDTAPRAHVPLGPGFFSTPSTVASPICAHHFFPGVHVGILLTWPLWTLLFNRCVTEVFKT
jgi:hypothetical protein